MNRALRLVVLLGLILAACGAGLEPEVADSPTTTLPPTSTTNVTSTVPVAAVECSDQFPVFYPVLEPPEGVASTSSDGREVRTWAEDEYGLEIEATWPGELPTSPMPGEDGVLHREVLENGTRLVLQIDGDPGCDLLAVELTADRIEPLVDFELSFIQDIRPIAQLDEYLNPTEPEIPPAPAGPAYRVVEEFLESAGTGEWEFAASLLFNEGIFETVETDLGLTFENWDEAPIRLAAYCETALCDAPYELVGIERDDPWITAVLVEFESDSGPVEWRARLGQFEGIYSLGELPPQDSASPRPSLSSRLFGTEESFAAIWYDAVQLSDPTGGQWLRWWSARFGNNQVLNRWGISQYGQALAIDDLIGEFEPEFIEFEDVPYIGSGVFDGREVVYLGADNVLLELDVASLNVEPKLEASDPEAFVGTADAAGDTVAMLVGVGDSLWVEFYDIDLELISSTRDQAVHTFVSLGPDGATAAVAIELELNVINQVGLVDVATGTQLESWGYPGPGLIGEVEYNGRFIVANVYLGDDEPPQLFIVDTESGSTDLITTTARIQF